MSPVNRVRRSVNATAALLSVVAIGPRFSDAMLVGRVLHPRTTSTSCRVAIVRVWEDLLHGGAPWRHDLFAVQPLESGSGATTALRAAGTVAERRGLVPACNVLTVAYVARSLALVTLFGGPGGTRTPTHAVGDHVHRPAWDLRTAPLLRRTELARAVTGQDHRHRARSHQRNGAHHDHRAPRRVDDLVERDGFGRARGAALVRLIVLESWDASGVGKLGVATSVGLAVDETGRARGYPGATSARGMCHRGTSLWPGRWWSNPARVGPSTGIDHENSCSQGVRRRHVGPTPTPTPRQLLAPSLRSNMSPGDHVAPPTRWSP